MPLGTPTSFIAKRTFRNEHDGGGDPLFVHSPDVVDGEDGAGERASERRYPSQYITVTALPPAAAAPGTPLPLLRLLEEDAGREKAAAAAAAVARLVPPQQESSPMTKWKVRPSDRRT